jgi:hypothetical protein
MVGKKVNLKLVTRCLSSFGRVATCHQLVEQLLVTGAHYSLWQVGWVEKRAGFSLRLCPAPGLRVGAP